MKVYEEMLLAADSGLHKLFHRGAEIIRPVISVEVWNAFANAHDDGRLLCKKPKCGDFIELSSLLPLLCGLELQSCRQQLEKRIAGLTEWLAIERSQTPPRES